LKTITLKTIALTLLGWGLKLAAITVRSQNWLGVTN